MKNLLEQYIVAIATNNIHDGLKLVVGKVVHETQRNIIIEPLPICQNEAYSKIGYLKKKVLFASENQKIVVKKYDDLIAKKNLIETLTNQLEEEFKSLKVDLKNGA